MKVAWFTEEARAAGYPEGVFDVVEENYAVEVTRNGKTRTNKGVVLQAGYGVLKKGQFGVQYLVHPSRLEFAEVK